MESVWALICLWNQARHVRTTRIRLAYADVNIDTAELDSREALSHGVPSQAYDRWERNGLRQEKKRKRRTSFRRLSVGLATRTR